MYTLIAWNDPHPFNSSNVFVTCINIAIRCNLKLIMNSLEDKPIPRLRGVIEQSDSTALQTESILQYGFVIPWYDQVLC